MTHYYHNSQTYMSCDLDIKQNMEKCQNKNSTETKPEQKRLKVVSITKHYNNLRMEMLLLT